MTRQEVPPPLTLSGAVLEAQWDRVGHITLSDRCRRPVGREKKKKPRCLIFGTRTIVARFFLRKRAVPTETRDYSWKNVQDVFSQFHEGLSNEVNLCTELT